MYRIRIKKLKKAHRFEELIKLFFRPEDFIIVLDEKDNNASRTIGKEDEEEIKYSHQFEFEYRNDNNLLSRSIYNELSKFTGKTSPWGIMTGIRPIRIFRGYVIEFREKEESLYKKYDVNLKDESIEFAYKMIQKNYLLSKEKANLLKSIYEYQEKTFEENREDEIALYIGIPFCPTRCYYCSFTSVKGSEQQIEEYLSALIQEVEFVGDQVSKNNLKVESIYIGGGTPTTLNKEQLIVLLEKITEKFDVDKLKEFTLEAGRVDTIDFEKLGVIKKYKVNRISINPQTMNDETLKKIGRNHNSNDIIEAINDSRKIEIPIINCDLIVGLEGESFSDFKNSLERILEYEPENITIHTLSVKRSSKLIEKDKDYNYNANIDIHKILEYAYSRLAEEKYIPYYIYRQKNMVGLGENVGFTRKDKESVYNYRIMEERQNIVALGAGAISKVYYPKEDRIERIANVMNFDDYIDRIKEMKERKLLRFFQEVKDVSKST